MTALRHALERHPGWRAQRACIGCFAVFVGPERDVAKAREICGACPVRALCLAEALVNEEEHEIWGGLDFAERAAFCPICGEAKEAHELGCTPAHSLLRLARLLQLEVDGHPSVEVSARQRPSARTNEDCQVLLGRNHSSARAYKDGCRCDASRRALAEERRERRGAD